MQNAVVLSGELQIKQGFSRNIIKKAHYAVLQSTALFFFHDAQSANDPLNIVVSINLVNFVSAKLADNKSTITLEPRTRLNAINSQAETSPIPRSESSSFFKLPDKLKSSKRKSMSNSFSLSSLAFPSDPTDHPSLPKFPILQSRPSTAQSESSTSEVVLYSRSDAVVWADAITVQIKYCMRQRALSQIQPASPLGSPSIASAHSMPSSFRHTPEHPNGVERHPSSGSLNSERMIPKSPYRQRGLSPSDFEFLQQQLPNKPDRWYDINKRKGSRDTNASTSTEDSVPSSSSRRASSLLRPSPSASSLRSSTSGNTSLSGPRTPLFPSRTDYASAVETIRSPVTPTSPTIPPYSAEPSIIKPYRKGSVFGNFARSSVSSDKVSVKSSPSIASPKIGAAHLENSSPQMSPTLPPKMHIIPPAELHRQMEVLNLEKSTNVHPRARSPDGIPLRIRPGTSLPLPPRRRVVTPIITPPAFLATRSASAEYAVRPTMTRSTSEIVSLDDFGIMAQSSTSSDEDAEIVPASRRHSIASVCMLGSQTTSSVEDDFEWQRDNRESGGTLKGLF